MAENMLQVINVGTNHWAVFSTCSTPLHSHNPDEALSVDYYDSLYSKLPEDAETIISFLLGQNSCFKISLNCIPIHKQAGYIDCGLYAIALATSIAHGVDPETQVYRQDEMRQHLLICLEKKQMTVFPVMRTKHT